MRVQIVGSIVTVLGAGLIALGAWMIYRPAGLIVGGGLLLAVGVDALRPRRGGT